MGDPLSSYLMRLVREPEALRRSLDGPVLLYAPPLPKAARLEDTGRFQLKTVTGSGPVDQADEALVFRLRKVKDNAFQRGITVGRTANNDVVLDHGSISRFHAWFTHEPRDGVRLVDADSKNGTWVDGERLVPKRPFDLGPREKVRFGKVEVLFLEPGAFWDELQSRLRHG